jgi:hypothetical protein
MRLIAIERWQHYVPIAIPRQRPSAAAAQDTETANIKELPHIPSVVNEACARGLSRPRGSRKLLGKISDMLDVKLTTAPPAKKMLLSNDRARGLVFWLLPISRRLLMDSRRVTTSMALIVLVCFFLPWVQLSCGASESRLSGVDLARDSHGALWLIPLLMVAVLFLSLARAWKDRTQLLAIVSLVAGLVSAYLMNRERIRADDTSGLIAVRLTGWFWLGLSSTIALVIVSALRFLKRPRTS